MSVEVDIRNKCRNRCTCPWKNSGLITTKTGSLKDATDYGYCTHEKVAGQGINGLTYNRTHLQIEDEKTGSPKIFKEEHSRLDFVTVYYHIYDRNAHVIKAPLFLRVKDHAGAEYKWYENVSTNEDNKTWRKINKTSGFPTDDPGKGGSEFRENLDRVTCSLHNIHRVEISRNGQSDPYGCPICKKAKVIVKPGVSVNGIYTRFEHIPMDDGKYYLSHGNNLVKYKESSKHNSKFLSVKKGDTLSVYYWEGDEKRTNPLIIELKRADGGGSNWYASDLQYKDKNYKWIKLKQDETANFSRYGEELKAKLDYLSCTVNSAVRIKLGRDSGCHDSRDSNHKSTISTRHNGIFNRSPFISAYEYTPSKESGGKSFSVAEVLLQGERQKSESGNLFLKDVTKLSSYASFCDPTNPFIIRVEYSDCNEWYQRNSDDKNTWEKKHDLSDQIEQIFANVKKKLNITPCPPAKIPPQEGIQINITEQPENDTLDGTYVSSSSGNLLILISKDVKTLPHGFFRVTHQTTAVASFKLSKTLSNNGDQIGKGGGPSIPNVQYVSVYFWDGEPSKPILLGIKQGGNLKYYSRSSGTTSWIQGNNDKFKKLVHMLDDKNCQRNNAIPFDIKEPTKDHADGNSNCLKIRKITGPTSSQLPGGDYAVREYAISGDARMSRVTFDGIYTNIGATKDTVNKAVVYYWKNDPNISSRAIPLLVGFVKNGLIDWYENDGIGSQNLYWKPIDGNEAKKFYEADIPQPSLTEKLDEVSCRIHRTVKIDISKNSGRSYCHSRCIPTRIKVVSTGKTISGYIGYDHIAIKGQTFTVTSIIKNDRKENINLPYPLKNVKKVAVYSPVCSEGVPVIHIGYKQSTYDTWLKNEKGQWTQFNLSNHQNYLLTCQEARGSFITKSNPSIPSGDDFSASEAEEGLGGETDSYLEPTPTPQTEANEGEAQYLLASAPSAPETSQNDSPPNSNQDIIKTTISVATGILTTSALACFAGWKLYNRFKGDPWVRQI
ncbi:hypothetical protein BEWA_020630 [Theileria equi strain WA]|uniref:Uncharacterized protein n=1 Tax=Theileria equi strain WA TaxID=1537102 RepID=L0AW05_THEEQ|nr:hypothetical protein BEWA_020630 [Theileria equi strain WA]AFZ79216.1 hypothetical protein BEWA_020630 [Theileria equi strain WA]|eukprot:XP_004828882.1 hypothetical protein BEWA_020630 [Theileria equi strain WA]